MEPFNCVAYVKYGMKVWTDGQSPTALRGEGRAAVAVLTTYPLQYLPVM